MSQHINQAFYVFLNSHDSQTLSLSLVQKHNGREEQLVQGLIKIADYKKLLKQFKTDYFYRGTPDLEHLGETLYQFLEGPLDFGRHLDTTRQQIVFFDANKALGQLPWEILHNGSSFLINRRGYQFYPIRLAAGISSEVITTQNRSLNALFMAASPEGSNVLDYEQEEAKITQATEHTHVYLDIEDSGTLAGIEERLTAHYEPYDVLHITGHASTQTTDSRDSQSAFILENELGQPSPTSVDELYDVIAEGERQPKLVFLSGCSTAQAHSPETEELKSVESMAQALADCGVNTVLGWSQPVFDTDATEAAMYLYKDLSEGTSIFKAVANTRKKLLENNHSHWHLLRLFAREDCNQPLVTPISTPERRQIPKKKPETAFLDTDNKIRVCLPEHYIGQRRLLQQSMRALRSGPGRADFHGLLLYAIGGAGKSSTANKLLHRFDNSYQKIVIAGVVNEASFTAATNAKLTEQQRQAFEMGDTLKARINHLLATNPSIIWVFDDFEQNTEQQLNRHSHVVSDSDFTVQFTASSEQLLNDLLTAIAESGYTNARLLVTSRYIPKAFEQPAAGVNVDTAYVPHLNDIALNKKLKQLEHISKLFNSHNSESLALGETIKTLCAGNPRLLESFEKLLTEQTGEQFLTTEDFENLIRTLEQKQQHFREGLFLETLFLHLPADERRLLVVASIYEIPVTLSAITCILDGDKHSDDSQILNPESFASEFNKAHKLGLIEASKNGETTTYYVSPLVRNIPEFKNELTTEQWQVITDNAADYSYWVWFKGESNKTYKPCIHQYDNITQLRELTGTTNADESQQKESLRLALLANNTCYIDDVADYLSYNLINQYRHREVIELCTQAIEISNSWVIHTRLGEAKQYLGLSSANSHFDKVEQQLLIKFEYTFDELHALYRYSNYLFQRNKIDEVVKLNRLQIPHLQKLGADREIAICQGQIADVYFKRKELEEALTVRLNDELPVYERLGDARSIAACKGKIAAIYCYQGKKGDALSILKNEVLPIFNELSDLSSVAVCLDQIANIYEELGQLTAALSIHKEGILPVLSSLKDEYSKASCYSQIAHIYYCKKEWDKALSIRLNNEMPMYERMGDSSLMALCQSKIADLYYKKLDYDKWMELKFSHVLPTFAQLDDERQLSLEKFTIALQLFRICPEEDKYVAMKYIEDALIIAKRKKMNELEEMERIAKRMGLTINEF